MAALIDMSNRRANIAYMGETPWHGLGQAMPENADLTEWRREAGMEWNAEKVPVEYVTAKGPMQADGMNVLYRSDTGAALSVVSDRYQPVQPQQVIDFYRDLCKHHDFKMETAGCLRDGKVIWGLARTEKSLMLPGADRVNQFVLLSTSFDGSMATTGRWTSVRVVCNNTLQSAVGGKAEFSLRHSSVFDADAAKQALVPQDSWDQFVENARKLAETPVTPEQSVEYFMGVYHDVMRGQTLTPRQNTSVEKTVRRLVEQLQFAPGAAMASARGTAWGLVNAVTHDVDFAKRARSSDNRLTSAWYGTGAALKDKAVQAALALAA